MKTLTTITDPVYAEPQKFSRYEKFWLKYINDKRDLPFIHLLTGIHILVVPVAILLYTPVLQSWYWWLVYIPYFYVSQMYFKGRFGLMLHCIVHRKLFKKNHTWLYRWVIWFVCPFFGHTPETYFVHHMGMHHVANNMLDDASSTLPLSAGQPSWIFSLCWPFSYPWSPGYLYVLLQKQEEEILFPTPGRRNVILSFLRGNEFCKF